MTTMPARQALHAHGSDVRADASLALVLPVLGLPTRFETNSPAVLGMVDESFGVWRGMPVPAAHEPPFVVRILMRTGTEGNLDPVTIHHVCPDATRVLMCSPGSIAESDPSRRQAIAHVTTTLVAQRELFRSEMLEAMTLALLSAFDRHPLHAAALMHGEHALLLSAPSGTGKSTLSYLGARAGLSVLSEDRVWLQLSPTLRVWGWPGSIRLRTELPTHFPELAHVDATPHRGGAHRLAIAPHRDRGVAPLFADRIAICTMQRGADVPWIEAIDRDALAATLRRDTPPGFDRFPDREDAVLSAITRLGGWRLHLSDDPRAALPLLHRMFAGLD